MDSKDTSYSLELSNPPPLTEKQQAEIASILASETVDTSDIAELGDEFWQRASQNPFYKPTKSSTTVRLDADVLAWLKSQGKGYQTRINAILRSAMLSEARVRNT
jgi:uncharacterized protein (DUF4415 family)